MGCVSIFFLKIRATTNENIVEIDGFTMDGVEHVATVSCKSITQARELAKEYLEGHPLYVGKWDKGQSKYIVTNISKTNKHSAPYKTGPNTFVLYFVGIQF